MVTKESMEKLQEKMKDMQLEEAAKAAITEDSIKDLQKRMQEAAVKDEARGISATNASSDKKMKGEGDGYSWKQEQEELEVYIPFEGSLTKKDIKIEFTKKALIMEAPNKLKIELEQPIEPMGCGWTMADGKITATLEKATKGYWSDLVKK
eukprot:TRINITY_DN7785_c0_g1_i1.p1 TRINITY_DN7785_c0_g1~~TRINITY_DN7785_c0_g1_i1.p1  ORF type:complete len:151 (-),score=71.55 TRINITY_DN7785_c0_g1_i1:154-606(-)